MTYETLLAQRAELDKQIADARALEHAAAVSAVREVVAKFKLEPADIFAAKRKPSANKGKTAAPKYRDDETGKTWSGRGLAPKWLAGKDKADYLIA